MELESVYRRNYTISHIRRNQDISTYRTTVLHYRRQSISTYKLQDITLHNTEYIYLQTTEYYIPQDSLNLTAVTISAVLL